jgi:GWxTD domain-containing protein
MRLAVLVFLSVGSVASAADLWLQRVEAVMNSQERQRYLVLSSEVEREGYRAAFWNDKAVDGATYFERVSYADVKFGSGAAGSGANTDQGRVYVALGPPTQISQLPSSRILQPLEIWRYDHIAGLPVTSEIQLLFFRARGVGYLKLYSPQIHTIRALIINNAGTRGAFPANDIATAAELPERLNLSPAELEAVDAAFHVARGISGSGNSELLYRISSPAAMIRRETREKVQSRIITTMNRPTMSVAQYRTPDNIPAVDITAQTAVKELIGIEINGVETFQTKLDFPAPAPVTYRHRLYLLPGKWNITLISDGQRTVLPVTVHPLSDKDELASTDLLADADSRGVPVTYRANPTGDAQWVSVGREYLQSGDVARATVCFRKALAVQPANADALAGQGKVFALQGKLDAARESLRKALELQPAHYEALVALAAVTAKFQDYPKALEYYRQAKAIRPSAEIEAAIRELAPKSGGRS